jgi:ABC-type nitrate/sulfonate/bicarbonate transport system substrate-binding protein
MTKKLLSLAAGLCALIAASAVSAPALAQAKKMVIAAPGIPPIYAAVVLYVAEKEGLFKKHGVDVEVRAFETGTAAARAVLTGDIEISLSPTNLIINQISNANAPVVAIYGFPEPDWVVATTDASKKACADLVGQQIGVDAVGGARSIALRTMLSGGCPDLKIEQLQQVALSSNTAPAMVAGQLKYGVLHLDDLAILEAQGKKPTIVLDMRKTTPTNHYLLVAARQDKVKENRDAYVRAIAAITEAARFMQDPKNADRVADHAAPTGHNKEINKLALKQFLDIGFWAFNDDGLDQKKLDAMIEISVRTGGIQAGKEPVKYDRLVDRSIWKDGAALVK